MKVGIAPRRSSSVCSFTAALVEQRGIRLDHGVRDLIFRRR